METEKLASMVEVFEGLEDWRNAQQTRHVLSELLTVAVCAVLSGADDFEEVSQWGRERLDWLRGFLTLDYGVASPDTFERVFALLDPKGFEGAFRSWVGLVIPALGRDQVIAIDGTPVPLTAQTVCVHGDTAEAMAMIRRIRARTHKAFIVAVKLNSADFQRGGTGIILVLGRAAAGHGIELGGQLRRRLEAAVGRHLAARAAHAVVHP